MERKVKIMFLVFSFSLLFFSQNCLAGDPIRKLGRGIANTTLGWLEIPAEFFREADRSSELGIFIVAPLKGFFKAIGRTLVGIYEVATFIIPIPSHYRPPIEPEFIL